MVLSNKKRNRMKIKDKILSETSEEVKQRVRDTANKLVMKQEWGFLVITEEAMDKFAIGFAEWLNGLDINDYVLQKHISSQELLEIYKKDKGL